MYQNKELTLSALSKENEPLPSFKKSLILIHPSTIDVFHFAKGNLLFLKNENSQLLFKCWPCSSIQPDQLLVPESSLFSYYLNNAFSVSRYSGFIYLADEIILSFEHHNSFMDSQDFKAYIRKQLNDVNLIEGMKLHFSYLGYPCSSCIKEIVNYNGSFNESILTEKDLCTDFSNLDLSSLQNEVSNSEDLVHKKSFSCSTPIHLKTKTSNKCKSNCSNSTKKGLNIKEPIFFILYQSTQINIQFDNISIPKQISFKELGGLEMQIKEVKTYMDFFLHKDSSYSQISYGILFIGPPGTGKSMMINAIQSEYKVPVLYMKNKMNEYVLKKELKHLFQQAVNRAPCIIYFDKIDNLCYKRKHISQSSQLEDVISELSTCIYNVLNSKRKIMVIGSVHNSSFVDMRLRKPGVLEKEINFPIPSSQERKEIISKILRRSKHELNEQQISKLSEITHGFTGGNLEQLISVQAKISSCLNNACEISSEPIISWTNIEKSLKKIIPGSMLEFKIEVPNVTWSDIGGMQDVKNTVIEMVDWPLKHKEEFKRFNISPSKGVLLYGPPGCSKTMIAKALVCECHLNFISIKGPQLFNKFVGESEKSVSDLFKKARSASPCVLFFDEIDSLASVRGSTSGNSNVADRVLTQLLIEIDGVDVIQGISIIAATNRPDMIDPSLLRPGRFDHVIYVPLPDALTRKEIFKVKLRKMSISPDLDLSYLVNATNNFTGAEITNLCQEAAMSVIEDDVTSKTSVVTMNHFLQVLHTIQPRTTKETIEFYENYANKFSF